MLVLIDRDGVINEDLPVGCNRLEDFRFIDGSIDAIARLKHAGYAVAICTNQSAISKGLLTEEGLAAIHAMMQTELEKRGAAVDAIYHCPDLGGSNSTHRKPAPGMLLDAMAHFDADPSQTPFIGDAVTDFQAAQAAGCPFFLVQTGKGKESVQHTAIQSHNEVKIVANLAEAVTIWLQRSPYSD